VQLKSVDSAWRGLLGLGRGALAELGGKGGALVGLAAAGAGLAADFGAFFGADELEEGELGAVADAVARAPFESLKSAPALSPCTSG
jgi:hypothetical protein